MNKHLSAVGMLFLVPAFARAEDPYVYYPSTQVAAPVAATPATPAPGVAGVQTAALNPDQLNSLIAPIALYPDALLSQILVAATYPLEVVQAAQWQDQHAELKDQALTTAAAAENWDPSIQALVPFPDVLKRLAQDITWTTNLGNAFLADQSSVMDAVQRMRLKAEEAGKLSTTPQQKVTTTTDGGQRIIVIQPSNPEVIYVPTYNPVWIWGSPYPYYPYPTWDYPVAPVGFYFYWGSPIWCSHYYAGWHNWDGWGWHPYWGQHRVIVNNVFIHENHFNVIRGGAAAGRTPWEHSPYHREGVPYSNRGVRERFVPGVLRGGISAPHGESAPGFAPRTPASFSRGYVNPRQVQEQLHQSSLRMHSINAGPDRLGGRQISPTGYNRNRSVFGGMEQGSAARGQSQRGYSSLHNRQVGGSAPATNAPMENGGRGGAPISNGGNNGHGGGGGEGHFGGRGGSWGGHH